MRNNALIYSLIARLVLKMLDQDETLRYRLATRFYLLTLASTTQARREELGNEIDAILGGAEPDGL